MATVTFNTTTLAIGSPSRIIGPVHVTTPITSIALSIDKTIPNGFNATPATVVVVSAQTGPSSTGPWLAMGASTHGGGLLEGDGGVTETTLVDINGWNPPLASGWVRYVVDVSGAAVAVQGSLVAN